METNLENPLSRQNQFSHVNTNKAWKWKSLNPVQLRNCPGQNTGLGSLSLLQGIFPTQGSDPALLHCRWILYQLRHQGSPRILEWVAYTFSSRSSQPRNRTEVSCIAGRFFTNYQGSPAVLFSRGSSQPRDWTQVSHIAGRFFTSWGTKEA